MFRNFDIITVVPYIGPNAEIGLFVFRIVRIVPEIESADTGKVAVQTNSPCCPMTGLHEESPGFHFEPEPAALQFALINRKDRATQGKA